jgi:peptidoglycan L-alanyl-D-glutamate endopeptidase CwlK
MLFFRNIIPVMDSQMRFEEAINGTQAPGDVIDALCLVHVCYYAFDGLLHEGQLVVHRAVREDVIEIFRLIEQSRFPVARVVPIVRYDWSDDQSMADNNTSAFNYRFVLGTDRLSRHAFGRAVDINPRQNPVIYGNGRISPDSATYNIEEAGTFSEMHPLVIEFLNRGWQWGGHFKTLKDYHHFDKPNVIEPVRPESLIGYPLCQGNG